MYVSPSRSAPLPRHVTSGSAPSSRAYAGSRASASRNRSLALDHDVVDVAADHHGEVAGQRPRCGGPRQQLDALERPLRRDREPDGDGRVLHHLVDLVVHPQLVVGQRRLVVPAVGQDAEALVDQALVVELLEGPDDRLHVVGVHGPVVVVEVDPARLAGDVLAPLAGVLHHRRPAGVVELLDAHLDDLVGRLDPQLAHGLELGGQAVGVPPEPALDATPTHGLVARDQVLDVAGEQVAVVGQAVGERRPVVEDELVGAVLPGLALVDAGLEGVVGLPVGQHRLLDRREARARRDAAATGDVGVGDLGVRHRLGFLAGRAVRDHEDDITAAVPPRLPPRGVTASFRAVTGLPVRVY